MNTLSLKQDQTLPAWLKLAEHVSLAVVMLVAVLELCAWLMPALRAHLPGMWSAMGANSAGGVLLAVASLYFSEASRRTWQQVLSRVLAALLALLALVTLLEHILGVSMGTDALLVRGTDFAGDARMSLQTAWALLLLGLLLPWNRSYQGIARLAADALTFLLAGSTLVLFAGELFGDIRTAGTVWDHLISPQSLLCLILLTSTVIGRRVGGGAFSILMGDRIGSHIARIAAPVAILLPLTLAVTRIYVTRAGLVSDVDSTALIIGVVGFTVFSLILLMAWYINRLQQNVHDFALRIAGDQVKLGELRYAELVDQALEGITVRKPGGEFLFVNDTFCRMLGYSRAEFLRMDIREVVHPEDAETIEQVQRLNNGGILRLEKRMRRKDGSTLHVEVSVRRLQDGNFQSTVQDVSERKRGEQRFHSMVEGAPNAMIMAGEDGAITMANLQAEKLFGYTREELLGLSIDRLVPERFRGGHSKLRNGYNRDPQMRSMGAGRDLRGLRKDGKEVPVEIGLNPIVTHEGRFVLASIIDITERRLAEQREQAYMDELRLMSQRLLEAQETERRAIARELHDEIGQALTAARMNLRELERQAGEGPLAEQAADASAIVAALLQQVRQLSLDLHPTVLDDLGLAAALRWLIRTRAASGGLNVIPDLAEDLPRLTSVIEHTAFRVFQEALSNVLRHSDANKLEVKLTLDGDRLLLDIRDDGKGFDLGAARKHALAGASLGVIGMQERVRLANGHIVIESNPGQGTLVRVSLPAEER